MTLLLLTVQGSHHRTDDCLHRGFDMHFGGVDDQIVIVGIGNVGIEGLSDKRSALRFSADNTLLGFFKGNLVPLGNILNSDLQGCDNPHTESLVGWEDETGASADNDGTPVLPDGTDNFQKMLKINAGIEILIFNE